MRVKVEVCVSSMAEARTAAGAGVDGLEVCSWPTCGGITPSRGLVEAIAAACQLPVRVLVRPGPGGFMYGPDELHLMERDCLHWMYAAGPGLVVGALGPGRLAHKGFIQGVHTLASGRELTFHRAVDQAADPLAVLDQCMEIGVDRILTSGGAPKAIDGAHVLAGMVERARRRIAVAAAGGIGPDNVVEIVERTGVGEVHFAAWRIAMGYRAKVPMSSAVAAADRPVIPDEAKIEGVLDALVKAGLR